MLRYFFTPGSPLGMPEGVRSQTPPREKGVLKSPQAFQNPQIKNLFSADDAQSNAERILNRLTRRPQRRRVAAVQSAVKIVLCDAHYRAGQRNYADEVR